MDSKKTVFGKLVTIGLVLLLFVFALSILMPALRSAKIAAVKRSSEYELYSDAAIEAGAVKEDEVQEGTKKRVVLPAVVEKFDAEINLTPKLSVGTATPESIYIAEFNSTIDAKSPEAGQKKCQIELPLPPKVISLADVDVKVDGNPSEDFTLKRHRLIWQGELDSEKASEITVTYSATGKGVYKLEKPSGKIINLFKTRLVANRSNIRMLELSLQPNNLEQSRNKTVYTWEYKRLVVAKPIAIDVLGLAAIDRLGELTWLGPLSVLVFGILIALVALAYDPEKLNGWVVVLAAGCFAGAYPMMYFLQDFVSLPIAIGVAAVIVLSVLGWRVVSLCGLRQGMFGGLILPVVMLLLTLAATIDSNRAMQGVLLTAMGIFAFVVAMVLLPGAQAKLKEHTAEGRKESE